ncbi:MAG: hypothetical protein IKP77_00715 [Acholeplasmatales bacterium]|nr:hypothetical protein [Acholeplasmatales bacterium]
MEYYEEDEGISLGQIFKVIFRRWKLLLIIVISILVIGILGTQLVYNKYKTSYSSTVEYVNVIGSNEDTYINNSKFNYRDIIKINTLNEVKNSDEKFSSIDVQKMVDEEDITITKNTKESSTVITFTLTAKGKYFKNKEQAKLFLYKVIYTPVNDLLSLVKNANNKVYVNAYKDALDYESQIDFLQKEIELLDSKYANIISLYPESSVNNKSVSDYKVALENQYGKITNSSKYKVIEDLKNELTAKNYVKNFDANEDELINNKNALEKQIEDNEAVIEALEARIEKYNGSIVIDNSKSSEALQPFTSEISRLTTENTKMQNEIDVIDAKISAQGGTELEIKTFEAKLTSLHNNLVKSADEYTEVSIAVSTEYANLEYTGMAIETNGALGLVIAALLFLVAGFIVGAVVNLIIDRKYLKVENTEISKIDSKKESIESEDNNQ